ncbi:MAG: hypothetical protein GVY27_05665, partial [Deinococcus-Thermus bacterium]|nr:hypothetical protein [Deinococcota bacterium]
PWHLLSKRLLGQVNLWVHRRSRFDMSLVERIIGRIEALEPDLLLCPGDVTTTALHAEFGLARWWFGELFGRLPTLVIPGNHDRYTFTAARTRRFERYFGAWAPDQYPHRATFDGPLHVIAIDATQPNLLLDPGRVGRTQRAALAREIAAVPAAGRVIVMCHYTLGVPPHDRAEPRHHALVDESALRRVLRDADRPITFVHGHVHRPWCWRPAEAPNVVAINTGSPTHLSPTFPAGQGLWTLDTEDDPDAAHGWDVRRHVPDPRGQWTELTVPWPVRPGSTAPVQ